MLARATFLHRLNIRRREGGRRRLKTSVVLTRVAQAQAETLARDNTLHHNNFVDRVAKTGFRVQNECVGYTVGRPEPKGILKNFMESPPHRDNLMSSRVGHVGIGVKRRRYLSGNRYFWCIVCAGGDMGARMSSLPDIPVKAQPPTHDLPVPPVSLT